MKMLASLIAAVALVSAGAAAAAPRSATLAATLFTETSAHGQNASGQPGKKIDPDRGDNHASDRARLRVCGGTAPAATHSAICQGPASP